MPYDTPSPADLDRLMRGELVAPPRSRNSRIPKEFNDIVMRAMAPAVGERYQRAGELLDDLLAARSKWATTRSARGGGSGQAPSPRRTTAAGELQEIQGRLQARETPRRTILLALPQAAARAVRPLPVLWRSAVVLESRVSSGPVSSWPKSLPLR